MASKKKQKEPTAIDLGISIFFSYSRWKEIFDNGCADPTWKDGVNIELVRNHILYGKKRCEEVLKDNYMAYPDCYFFPEPVELPQDFMAKDRYLPCCRETFAQTKNMCYDEAIRFDWSEVMS